MCLLWNSSSFPSVGYEDIYMCVWMTPFNHHRLTNLKTCKIVEATATPDGGFDTCAL